MRSIFLPLVVCTLPACGAAVQRDGFTVEKNAMDEAETEVRRRAAFDLGCDGEQMKLTLLSVFDDAGADFPTQIGVEGCGKKATYVRQVFDGPGPQDSISGWEMNVVSTRAAPQD